MSAPIDCPICMDCIESTTKNCVTTECGHCFHTNCLMQSIAHNGFGCPYCRTKMAEEPEEEDEEDDEEEEEEEELYDDDALTSFRMFNQRLNGEEVEEEPEEEEEWESVASNEEEDQNEEMSSVPDAAYVAQKLVERGITMEDLVKNILFQEHSNWGEYYTENERRSSEVYGQFRAIITQFQPSTVTSIPTVTSTSPVTSTPAVQTPQQLDFSAQPKTSQVRRVPTFMIHV